MKNILILFVLILAACQPSLKKTSSSLDLKRVPRGQSSYYYYLLSQLNKGDPAPLLDLALKKDEGSSFLWEQKALQEAEAARLDEALKYAKESIKRDPKNFETYLLLGKIHSAQKKSEEALQYYQQAFHLDSEGEEIYNLIAREHMVLKDPTTALKILNTCLNKISEAMGCLYYMATIHLYDENYEEALRYFHKILEFNPDNPRILQTIADLYLKKKKYQKALETLSQLKQLTPDDATHFIRSGLIYYELKEIDKAIAEFQAVSQRFPDSDRINYFLGLLYLEKKEWDVAYGYFDKIKDGSLFFEEALQRQILILRFQDKTGTIEAFLAKKMAKIKASPSVFGLRISLLVMEGRYREALSVTNEALARYPDDGNFFFQRAVIYDKLNQWPKAMTDLKRVIAIDPRSDKAYNYLGYSMLEKNGDVDEAISYIQKALEISPNDGHVLDSLGWGYYKKGDYEQALSSLLKADRYRPHEPTILGHIGDVYFILKNKRLARQYYERSLSLLLKMPKRTPQDEEMITALQDKLSQF